VLLSFVNLTELLYLNTVIDFYSGIFRGGSKYLPNNDFDDYCILIII
jgi:hypothetical protein